MIDHRCRAAVAHRAGTIRLATLVTVAAMLVVWHSFGPTASVSRHAARVIVGYARVIDGDTIDVAGTRIRLHGIDAPESTQICVIDSRPYRCGERATLALGDLVRGHTVRCDSMGLDRYRRTLARCRLTENNLDIEGWLVRQGFAVAFRRYSSEYIVDEVLARIANRGLWAGTFQWPWDYRAETRSENTRRSDTSYG